MGIECTYCEEKINAKHGIYVNCITCSDVRLCLECFSSGALMADHETNHPYELIDCGSFSIIDESWKAYEELTLLEAIELYGIGNWTDIANAVETRTAEECCERYLSVYVENFFGRCTWNAIDKNAYTVKDHTCNHKQPLSPSLSLPEKDKIVDISREQQIRLGYMPKRDDFEREFDNEAELLVSKLAVNANDDTELDQEFKIAHINMYIDKLRERYRRKRIVLEYNLVKLFFHMHPEENVETNVFNSIDSNSTKTLEDNDDLKSMPTPTPTIITNNINSIIPNSNNSTPSNHNDNTMTDQDFNSTEKKIRIFCQFSSVEEHNTLIRNLARERELKHKIEEAIKKRKLGHKTNTRVNNGSESDSDASWRLLSECERKLCKSNNLKPSEYINYKANIMKVSDVKKRKATKIVNEKNNLTNFQMDKKIKTKTKTNNDINHLYQHQQIRNKTRKKEKKHHLNCLQMT